MSASKMGNQNLKGFTFSKESKEKMSKSHLGQVPWNKDRPMPEESRIKVSESVKKLWNDPEYRNKQSEAHKGKHGPEASNWQGGKSKEVHLIRNSPEMAIWREFVFERDNYQCQECLKWGGELRAHHSKSFAEYPRLRFQTWNGITLCEDCHRIYHSGGG